MFTNLLTTKILDGYPDDFVLARIRGRGYWTPESPGGGVATRRELDREYAWVFGMLDRKATKTFTPFFSLFEIERLVACLRLDRGRESTQISPIVAESLLSEAARSLLDSPRVHADKVRGIMSLLELPPDIRTGMERMLAEESWADLEACLLETCLQWAARSSRRKALKRFFQVRIDMRNMQTVHKALRWKSEKTPPLLEGGNVRHRSIMRFFEAKSLETLEGFARRRLAQRSTGNLEDDLIHGLAVRLHRQGRQEVGLSMVLSHLWGLYAGLREGSGKERGFGEVA